VFAHFCGLFLHSLPNGLIKQVIRAWAKESPWSAGDLKLIYTPHGKSASTHPKVPV
jgi:hypothetical protein